MQPELAPGFYFLAPHGDIGIDPDVGRYIGQLVEVVKVTKSGMVQVKGLDGKLISVPRRNLERR